MKPSIIVKKIKKILTQLTDIEQTNIISVRYQKPILQSDPKEIWITVKKGETGAAVIKLLRGQDFEIPCKVLEI